MISLFTYTCSFPPAIFWSLAAAGVTSDSCNLVLLIFIHYDYLFFFTDKHSVTDQLISHGANIYWLAVFSHLLSHKYPNFVELVSWNGPLRLPDSLHKASVYHFSRFMFQCYRFPSFLPQYKFLLHCRTVEHLLNLFWCRSSHVSYPIILCCLDPLGHTQYIKAQTFISSNTYFLPVSIRFSWYLVFLCLLLFCFYCETIVVTGSFHHVVVTSQSDLSEAYFQFIEALLVISGWGL